MVFGDSRHGGNFLNVSYGGVVVVDIAGLFGELRIADGNAEVRKRREILVNDFGFDTALGGFFKCLLIFGNCAFVVGVCAEVFGGVEELLDFFRAAHHKGR